ncbi:hypothetical protein BB559_005349 [Furculomyces boomerangus]|uniref:Uncharacterized protein n=2 Tax=Harpellales TaxID=61421 RepID=A0A2T9Y789_9FUNG|nr:hypothetical protein BB559_005671 [Furculomyces boomerangus]PVU88886.1 hypothetical protein BB559_005349 [Furculomyces boomerangus]PWA02986.1 hypothetical protein BB558_000850 [Smittium angustum]
MKSFTLILAFSLSSVFAIQEFEVYPFKHCVGPPDTFTPRPNECTELEEFKSARFGNIGKIKIYTESGCSGESYLIDLSKTVNHTCITTDIDQTYNSVKYVR